MSLIWRQDTSSQFKQTKILLEYQLLSNEWMSNCRLIQLALEPEIRIYIYIYRNQGPQYKRTRSWKVSHENLLIQTRKGGSKLMCSKKKNYFQEIYAKKLLGSETYILI